MTIVGSSYVSAGEAASIRSYVTAVGDERTASMRVWAPVEWAVATGQADCRYCGCKIDKGERCVAFGFDKNATHEHPFGGRAVRAYIHENCNGKEDA